MNFRDEEIKVLKKNALIFAAFAALFTIVPTLVLISSFATFVLSGNELSGIKAFVTLNYLNILRMPLGILPTAVTWIVQAMVSLRRIDKFLNNDELDQGMIEHETSDNRAIVV
jgi:ATP-binding cassette subfamily C (CFTR/MRP) protein 1